MHNRCLGYVLSSSYQAISIFFCRHLTIIYLYSLIGLPPNILVGGSDIEQRGGRCTSKGLESISEFFIRIFLHNQSNKHYFYSKLIAMICPTFHCAMRRSSDQSNKKMNMKPPDIEKLVGKISVKLLINVSASQK